MEPLKETKPVATAPFKYQIAICIFSTRFTDSSSSIDAAALALRDRKYSLFRWDEA